MSIRTTFAMIPTYNEAANIGPLLDAIATLQVPGHQIKAVVVDDNSPDGTALVVEKKSKQYPNQVYLLLRTKDRGRGSAGIAGFKYALEHGADYVIEMDADFSHDPKYIPALIQACDNGSDLVLGSRFVPGGQDMDRGFHRQIITKAAGIYTRLLLNLKVKDVSSGFRCFKKSVLQAIDLNHLISTGPSIVSEILYKTSRLGFKISEVPIIFIDRREGQTKLDSKILIKTALMVLKFRFNLKSN